MLENNSQNPESDRQAAQLARRNDFAEFCGKSAQLGGVIVMVAGFDEVLAASSVTYGATVIVLGATMCALGDVIQRFSS